MAERAEDFARILIFGNKLVDRPRAPSYGVPQLKEARVFAPRDPGIPSRDRACLAFPYCFGVILLSEPNVFNRLLSPPYGRLSF